MALPSTLDLARDWSLDPAALVLAAALALLYVRGVRRLAGRGHRWPVARTSAWLAGVGAIVVAAQSGLATYDTTSFTAHMGEHILLGMVAPLLLALGAPVTLAFRSSTRSMRAVLRGIVGGRVVRALANPLLGWTLFGGSLVALYFSPLLALQAHNPLVHAVVHVHIVIVGCLFLWPLVAVDALPRRLPHPLRLLALLAAVPFHAFLGIALLGATSPMAPDVYRSLADQHAAAGLLWTSGELLTVVATGIVFAQWYRADQRAGRRGDAAATQAFSHSGLHRSV